MLEKPVLLTLRVLAVCAVTFAVAGTAAAQLTAAQGKCADAMSKNLFKTATTAGKDTAACVKDHAKGSLGDSLAACLTADRDLKRAAATAKTVRDFDKKCAGSDAVGAFKLPAFGAVSAAATTRGGEGSVSGLLADVFGPDPDAAFATGTDEDRIKCQGSVLRAAQKCVDTRVKELGACTRAAIEGGAADATTLTNACLGVGAAGQPDAKGKIAKACDDPTQSDKIRGAIDAACVGAEVDLGASFPGCAAASAADLHASIAASALCHVCTAANASAGLTRNCDVMDDGSNNGSCAVCGNSILESGEQCDASDDGACPGQCLSLCACAGPRDFQMLGAESTVHITGIGTGLTFPLDATLSLDVTGELVAGAPAFDIPVQALPPATGQVFGVDQTLCVFFEQGVGLPLGIAGTGVLNCAAADVSGLTVLDSPNIQEYFDHCATGLPSTCDSAPNLAGGITDATTDVFVPDGPTDAGCNDPFFRVDANPTHGGNCIYGPNETAGPGPFRRGDATFTIRAVLDLRSGISTCAGGPTPGAPEAVLEFTTGRAQTGIMDMNGQKARVGSLIAFGSPFDCSAFLGGGDPAGATFVGTFPVLDISVGFGIYRDVLIEATLVGR